MTVGIILAACGIAAIYIGVADGGDPGFLRAGIVLVALGVLLPLLKLRAER